MARPPRRQRRTDARRIGRTGTGKLNRDASRETRAVRATPETPAKPAREASPDELRARVERARDEAVAHLRRLGLSGERDERAPRARTDFVLDEGDEAQASERQDMVYATRERVAARINRLTAALARMDDGTYGRCALCGGPIEPARLAAIPEAETCLRCQEQRERAEPERVA